MIYLIKEGGVPSSFLALGGYGEKHPIGSNDDPSGRDQNRRVEMIFKSKTYF
jgi:outer membrane protein OmpA-like peptidoglycan-associated protein